MFASQGRLGLLGQQGGGRKPFTDPAIVIDDGLPLPQTEGAPNVITFTVRTINFDLPLAAPIDFTYQTLDGTALAGLDFTKINPTAGQLPAATGTLNLQVSLLGPDTQWKPDRGFSLNISNALQGATPVTIYRASGLGGITDSLAKPTFSIANGTPDPAIRGTHANLTFTITATQTVGYDTLITFSTREGTAVDGTDYTGQQNQTATMLAGQSTVDVLVAVLP